MFNIDTYIRRDSIKRMMESHLFISDEDQVKRAHYEIIMGKNPRLIFDRPALKNMLLSMLQADEEQYNLINCACSVECFEEALSRDVGRIVFNNVTHCTDEDIIKIIDNTAGIILC